MYVHQLVCCLNYILVVLTAFPFIVCLIRLDDKRKHF